MSWIILDEQHKNSDFISILNHAGVWKQGHCQVELLMGHIQIIGIFIVCQHQDGTGSWNPSLWKTWAHLLCIFGVMVADILAVEGARPLPARILANKISCTIQVSAPLWLWQIGHKLLRENFKLFFNKTFHDMKYTTERLTQKIIYTQNMTNFINHVYIPV